jgi:hypothetical protein
MSDGWTERGVTHRWWDLPDGPNGAPPAAIAQVGPRWYRWGALGGGRGHERSLAAAKRAVAAWLAHPGWLTAGEDAGYSEHPDCFARQDRPWRVALACPVSDGEASRADARQAGRA